MRHWAFWEWIAYVALFVAALIIAADTGFRESPDVMARLPGFFHSEWWGFAPAVLVVMATIILLLREFVFSNNKLRQQAISKTSAPAMAPATNTKPKKVFVDVSPLYLIGLYENRTTIQGNDLAAAYIGKWISVTAMYKTLPLKIAIYTYILKTMIDNGVMLVLERSRQNQRLILHAMPLLQYAEKYTRLVVSALTY